ncbi:putative F-box protein At1g65770 [Mercurialis annua]|uniref:putative F-box protein At1g65770 n=1 Tax=Mercurialis annua TaxID=3986 RepID=UPI0021604D97|nr:putative F-box protein At1g65770 [Mercurialis annua]
MAGHSYDRNWADLPQELIETIANFLDSRIDVFRFRAVCTSWRSFVSSTHRRQSPTALNLPAPILADAFLSIASICRLELVDDADESFSKPNSWLTKVEESTAGEMQLLIPLSNRQIRFSPGTLPKMLNLLNFRLLEITKACTLKLKTGRPVLGIDKAVLFPNHVDINTTSFGIIAIFHEGKLGYWKNGDENWTLLDDLNFNYDDIVFYKGQYYVVDRNGTVSLIDSSLNLIQFSHPLLLFGDKKNLVESCGNLYVVDRYLDGERRIWRGNEGENIINQERLNNDELFLNLLTNYPRCRAKTVDFKVYKLDLGWRRWVSVRSLDDRIFVVSNEISFSVSAKEFNCWEGNCIYYTDPSDEDFRGGLSGYDARVFKLKDHSIVHGSSFLGCSPVIQPLAQLGPLIV